MTGSGPTAAIGAPIVSKDADEQVVTAPVLVPDQPDRERHEYRAENIASVARSFLPDGQIDAMHAGGEVGHPTESYVAPDTLRFDGADRTVPAGAWMLSAKVTDDDVWRDVKAGKLTGVSVFGPVRAVYDSDGEQLDIEEIARPVGPSAGAGAQSQPAVANSFAAGGAPQAELPPAPVGETWTVEFEEATYVSIVDDPAVQAASFVVAKSAGSSGSSGELIMDQDTEERFDELEALVQKSAESAEAAAESAEEAQSAAEQAVEGSDGGGGSDGESGDLSEEDVRAIVGDEVGSALDEADLGGNSGPDLGDLDDDTVEALTEAGVIDEEDLDDVPTGIEKRLAAIEKSIQNGGGRQGVGTQLDALGEDGEESGAGLVGDGDRAAAVKRAGTAGGEGGDEE